MVKYSQYQGCETRPDRTVRPD